MASWRSWTPEGRREGGSRRTLGYFRMGVSREYPTYGKNPGESERGERTERRERSQAHGEAQTQSPGGGLRGPLQLKGSPVDRVDGEGGCSPAGRKKNSSAP